MRSDRYRIAAALVGALCSRPIAGQAPTSPPTAATSVILGRVLEDLSDRPVGEALVQIRGLAEPYLSLSALTSTTGEFVFFNMPAGQYSLQAGKTGFTFGEFGQRRVAGRGRALVVAAGQPATDVRVPVWKSGAISGTILDESGEPVVDVGVQAMVVSTTGGRTVIWNAAPQSARTDDRGVYRISGLLPGDVLLSLPASELVSALPSSAPGDPAGNLVYPSAFYPAAAVPGLDSLVTITAGAERGNANLTLRTARTRRITGRVTGSSNLSAITVQLTRAADSFLDDLVIAEAVTRTDGSFAFPRVAPGDYVMRVFERSSSASDPGVSFQPAGQPPPAVRPERNDPDGWWAILPISVADTDLDNVAIDLHPTLRFSGHFAFKGSAPKPRPMDLALPLQPTPPSGRRLTPPGRAEVDAAFQFRTAELPAGLYFLQWSARAPGWALESITLNGRDAVDQPILLQNSDVTDVVITLTDQISEITGSVRNTGGALDLDTSVLLFPADPARRIDFGRESPRMRSARTGLDGRYVMRGLPPGEYLLAAVDDAVADRWQTKVFLDNLARGATRVTVMAAGKSSIDLYTTSIR